MNSKKLQIIFFLLLSLGFFTPQKTLAFTLSRSDLGSVVGLIGWWTFDGKNLLQNAVDSSGNSNTGYLKSFSSTTTTPGKVGQALLFDGTDDYVNAGDIASIDTATSLSGCAWVFHKSLSDDDHIINKDTSSDLEGFLFFRDNVGSVSGRTDEYTIFFADSADTDTVRIEGATNSTPLNIWTHVCFTFQAANSTGLRLYVNSVEDANSPVSTATIGAINAGTAVFAIGDLPVSSSPFIGAIDDVRIYNRVLSASEITQLYTMGGKDAASITLKGVTGGLVGYWTFDGKDMVGTTTAYDLSGNAKTATSFNFIPSSGSTNSWTYSTSGPSTFTPPAGVTSVTASAWGAGGGGGGNSQASADGGGGGGGGAYATGIVAVDPGTTYNLYVGKGRGGGINATNAVDGDDSMFFSSSTVMAKGGARGSNGSGTSPGTGGAGGQAASSFGTTAKWNGGYGESGRNSATGRGGYGGSSAGTGQAGIDTSVASWTTETAPTTNPTGSGVGGNGATTGSGSSPASGAGGGGGGSSEGTGNTGGTGADGKVIISYDDRIISFHGQVSGRIGQAVNFNGISDYFSVGNVYNGVKTVSFWVKVATSTSAQKIIDMNGTENIDISSNVVRANNFTGATIYVDGVQTTTLSDMNWHYVVVTATTGVNASAVDIGRISTGYFGGILDEVRFYSRVLPTSEITKGYQFGAPARLSASLPGARNLSSGLVAWWTLDGKNLLQNVVDSSGSGNTGYLKSFTSTTTIPGKIGQALYFDGTDDHITIGTNSFTTDVTTVSLWINPADTAFRSEFELKLAGVGMVMSTSVSTINDILLSVRGNLQPQTGAGAVSANKWNHVVIQYIGGGLNTLANYLIYVNGESKSLTNAGASGGSYAANYIGRQNNASFFYTGRIDDVRVYNRVLTVSEIRQLYTLGL